MNKAFENISESVLFDNLKRSANKWLRKLNDERDTNRKLENFKGKYPTIIQALLRDVGKQFFKIFLYQSIKSELGKKALTDFEKIEILKNTVKNFKFYFYPGYTILDGRRIFITGNKKNMNNDDRFLTGIGTTFIQVDSFEKLFDFLINKDARPNLIFDFEGEFWIDDIPSTIALDNLLNQHYVNKEIGENKFNVPSTHFWKSNQKRNDGSYMPMPLKSDETELRILKVSIGDKRFAYGKNQVEIFIRPSELLESGFTIAKCLGKEKIPIAWRKQTDKDSYTPWPFIDKTHKLISVEDDNIELELMAYSFWIAETLNAENMPILNYKNIRRAFNKSNLQQLSQKIYPFKKYQNNKKGLTEIYYNHWYTLFLESFDKEVDLGTAMLLTSYEYDQEFLMKCTHWLRWIYNELRLIEATVNEKIETKEETQDEDFRNIKHHLNALVSANNYLIKQREGQELTSGDIRILNYISSNMSAFINLEDILANPQIGEIDIQKEIELTIQAFRLCASDDHIYSKVFRIHIPDKFFSKHLMLNYFNISGNSSLITGPVEYFKLLIKDIIENLIKHSDLANPDCAIKIIEYQDQVTILFLNTKWPEEIDLKSMKSNKFNKTKSGWRNINLCIAKNKNWKLILPKNKDDKIEDLYFWIKLEINKQ